MNQPPVEDGYYSARMNVDWEFPSGSEPSTNAYVENSNANSRTVYFDLTIDETGEQVYSSPFIPVGASVEKFALETDLPEGEYPATVRYQLVDDDLQDIPGADVSVTVTLFIRG